MPHHLVYGGNRVGEFEQRLCGVSYVEIARGGGGIQATIEATRAADFEALAASACLRARRLMSEGVTTIEVKSGYALEFAGERRLLEVARALGRALEVGITTTFLGLHALPREFAHDRAAFVDLASGPWLESLAASGLVDAVDAFTETIGFTIAETERFLAAAARLGIRAHIHAGQLSDIGAADSPRASRALGRHLDT